MTEKKTARRKKAADPVQEPAQAPVSDKRTVQWTALGEERRAHSEHGMHVAGEIVETEYADILIERGFAEEA